MLYRLNGGPYDGWETSGDFVQEGTIVHFLRIGLTGPIGSSPRYQEQYQRQGDHLQHIGTVPEQVPV